MNDIKNFFTGKKWYQTLITRVIYNINANIINPYKPTTTISNL